ncbi:MAG: hypothetical protein R3D63_16195 [Paracoccaceae bacterium]
MQKPREAMGFCLFGTVATGVKRALDQHGLGQVAVVVRRASRQRLAGSAVG